MSRGWNTNRRDELPEDWVKRRKRVLREAGYACVWRMSDGSMCGEYANQVDHRERGMNHEYENLQALCEWHHARKTSQEGLEAKRLEAERRKKAEKMSHPGYRPLEG